MTKDRLVQISEEELEKRLKGAGRRGYQIGSFSSRLRDTFDLDYSYNMIENLRDDIIGLMIKSEVKPWQIDIVVNELEKSLKEARGRYREVSELEKPYFDSPSPQLQEDWQRFNTYHSTLCALIAPYEDKKEQRKIKRSRRKINSVERASSEASEY